MNKKIFIFSNESISTESNNFHCDNLDMKSIPEGLRNDFEVNLIARRSKIKRRHEINNVKIDLANNILSFIQKILATIANKEKSKFFIISITPYTFIAAIVLSLFKIKPYVYLRSDGYEEYNSIIGITGKFVYHIMFEITSKISSLISCRKHILREKKGKVVSPSHLSDKWMQNLKAANLNEINLLYVGRIRVEKGIFSLLNLFEKIKKNIFLSIVCASIDHKKIKLKKNIKLFDTMSEESLIDTYDRNAIFILPSFTEGHPQVLDEALSRLRPVIVFEEIKHVNRDRTGVIICKRDIKDLEQKIDYIVKDYSKIQEEIKKNKLPFKKDFLSELKFIFKDT